MNYQLPPDVESLVAEQIRRGGYDSTDDVLRAALQALTEKEADVAAIRAGIADMEAGRITPLRDVDVTLRSRFGFARPK